MGNVIRDPLPSVWSSPVCGADDTPWETPMKRPLVFRAAPGRAEAEQPAPWLCPPVLQLFGTSWGPGTS